MKKIIFGIFAHPDDEAFGPVGTLLKEIKAGSDVHLICLTPGDAGTNPDNVPDLGAVREKEWRDACRLLGAASATLLGYKDGQLNNLAMIEIARQVETIVRDTVSDNEVSIEFMSLDLNGYTGHIDHIVAARAACLAFYRLKKDDARLSRIRLACQPRAVIPTTNVDWIFMEAGRAPEEINETIDAREFLGQIHTIMQAHYSQRADYNYTVKSQGENLGLDHFIVKN